MPNAIFHWLRWRRGKNVKIRKSPQVFNYTVYFDKSFQAHWQTLSKEIVKCHFSLTTTTPMPKYSWLSLSRPRLSRITAYLEAKIWSLPIYENLTTDGKYCRKEEKLLLRSNFSSFPQYFQYISNFKSPITYQFVKCG